MTFVSLPFLCLFVITALLYKLVGNQQRRHIVLLIASYVFYAWWDYRFLALLVGQTLVSYLLGILIDKSDNEKRKKMICIVGIVISLGILGFFKYYNFFFASLASVINLNKSMWLYIILPVGISFYTFQAMSYLIDVYRGVIDARKDFVSVSLYISFFPQLVAGPIVRAKDFLPQLDAEHKLTLANVEKAIQIFALGLFKKCVIADRLAVCVDAVYNAPRVYDASSLICAAIAYSMQIYCDFSGYSDMAIGTAKFFGYDLCENFNLPYLSKNPSEFWKRWHISLSSWLQDYLYIPLGGNRKGKIRTYINLMLTMLLGGLWHGASWTFVVWGAMHGMALIIHKLWTKTRVYLSINEKMKESNVLSGCITVISMVCTAAFATICWIFFRAQDFDTAFDVIKGIFTWQGGVHYIYVYTVIYGIFLLVGHIVEYVRNDGNHKYPIVSLSKFWGNFALCMELMLIFLFAYGGNTAFVYFQF